MYGVLIIVAQGRRFLLEEISCASPQVSKFLHFRNATIEANFAVERAGGVGAGRAPVRHRVITSSTARLDRVRVIRIALARRPDASRCEANDRPGAIALAEFRHARRSYADASSGSALPSGTAVRDRQPAAWRPCRPEYIAVSSPVTNARQALARRGANHQQQ
jgi:hypothetical protein